MASIFLSSVDIAAATATLRLSTSLSRAAGKPGARVLPALAVIVPPGPRVIVFGLPSLPASVMDSV